MFKVNCNFSSGRRLFAGVVIAVLISSLPATSQAGLFNLEVQCSTLPYDQGEVPASSLVNFSVIGIDIDLANTFTYMGTSSVDYETTSGSASMDTGEFYLWVATAELDNDSIYAYFVIGTYDQDIIKLNTSMPVDFSFTSLEDYDEFFKAVNTKGVYNSYAALCYVPNICVSLPQQAEIIPEPVSIALLGMGTIILRKRRSLNMTIH